MKTLLIIGFVAMMSWQPSCDPADNPTSSSSSHNDNDYNPPTIYSTLVRGKVVDSETGESIDAATVCYNGHCVYSNHSDTRDYHFTVTSYEAPLDLKVTVSHPDYLSDSTVVSLRGYTITHDFSLKRKS